MDRKDMAAAMGGITTRQRTVPANVTVQEKAAPQRKVISVTYADYKKIKNYANDHDISITEAVTQVVESCPIL